MVGRRLQTNRGSAAQVRVIGRAACQRPNKHSTVIPAAFAKVAPVTPPDTTGIHFPIVG